MPILKNSRHEAFSQHKHQGLSHGEAYARAFNRRETGQYEYAAGERLMRNDEVLNRITELQERSAERADITVDRISTMLLVTHERAVKAGDLTNERQCAMDLAKLHGRIVDKSRVQNDNVKWVVSDKPMSREEWERDYGGDQSTETVN